VPISGCCGVWFIFRPPPLHALHLPPRPSCILWKFLCTCNRWNSHRRPAFETWSRQSWGPQKSARASLHLSLFRVLLYCESQDLQRMSSFSAFFVKAGTENFGTKTSSPENQCLEIISPWRTFSFPENHYFKILNGRAPHLPIHLATNTALHIPYWWSISKELVSNKCDLWGHSGRHRDSTHEYISTFVLFKMITFASVDFSSSLFLQNKAIIYLHNIINTKTKHSKLWSPKRCGGIVWRSGLPSTKLIHRVWHAEAELLTSEWALVCRNICNTCHHL